MGCTASAESSSSQSPSEKKKAAERRSVLNISDQNLSVLPQTISGQAPKSLIAKNNLLTRWPKDNKMWLSLEEVDLSSNRFTKIPEHLAGLPRLTNVNLANNPLARIGSCDSVSQLTKLQQVGLAACGLKSVPASLIAAHSITHLDLSGNGGIDLDGANLGRMSKLKTLDVAGCAIVGGIPKSIRSCSSLVTLNISANKVTDLNDAKAFGELLNTLEELHCDQVGWMRLPRGVCSLPNLTKLTLCRNSGLKDISGIGFLSRLKMLDLSDCGLLELPKGCDECEGLLSLTLNGNQLESLKSLSAMTGVRHLKMLRVATLTIGRSQENDLWASISTLPNLESLAWQEWSEEEVSEPTAAPSRRNLPLCIMGHLLRSVNGIAVPDRELFSSTAARNAAAVCRSSSFRADLWIPKDGIDALFYVAELLPSLASRCVSNDSVLRARYAFYLQIVVEHKGIAIIPPSDVLIVHYTHMMSGSYSSDCQRLAKSIVPNSYHSTLAERFRSTSNPLLHRDDANDSRALWSMALAGKNYPISSMLEYDWSPPIEGFRRSPDLLCSVLSGPELQAAVPSVSDLISRQLPVLGEMLLYRNHFQRLAQTPEEQDRYVKWLSLYRIFEQTPRDEGTYGLYATLGIHVLHLLHMTFPSRYQDNLLCLGISFVHLAFTDAALTRTEALWQETFGEAFVPPSIVVDATRVGETAVVGFPSFIHQPMTVRKDSMTKRSKVTIVE